MRASTATRSALLECPSHQSQSVVGTLLPAGGTLGLPGASITLPPGAVLSATLIRVTIPASPYVEVDITANDLLHFEFAKPVKVSISYARCTADVAPGLTAWYIDGLTKALLQDMGGVDDRSSRTVTFTTDHLSGYSVGYANPGDGDRESDDASDEDEN